MIYVRIELWPLGSRERARLLQEVTISNVGGDVEKGDYEVVVSHSTTYKGVGLVDPNAPPAGAVWKRATVSGWNRKLSPVSLLRRALDVLKV